MKNQSVTRPLKLLPDQLYRTCDIEHLHFETTDELKAPNHLMIGQDRALASTGFGIRMDQDGFNIYALGPEETDKRNLLEVLVNKEAEDQNVPDEWCYVCNFEDNQKPTALRLPPGEAVKLKNMMNGFVEDLPNILTTAFESEEYQNRRQAMEENLKEEEQKDFSNLQKNAKARGLTLLSTPIGYSFVPLKDGEIMKMEEMKQLSDEERNEIEHDINEFQSELQKILRQIPERQRKFRKIKNELNKEFADFSIRGLIEEIEAEFGEQPEIVHYLEEVRRDIIDHVEEIINPGGSNLFLQTFAGGQELNPPASEHPVLWRYGVNIMVNNADSEGAPVIYEDNPTYNNLVGSIEHVTRMGTLTTDYTYIKPGSLHRANGGYLLLDAQQVLTQPFAWEGLKRALLSGKIKIESPGQLYGIINTVTLDPDPVDLDVKVILLGSRLLYYLLCTYDPDFKTLFKVEVDFEDEIDWNPENQELYAELIAGLAQKYDLNPLNRPAVARVIEQAARRVNDNRKITAHIRYITDLLRETDYWSRQEGEKVTGKTAVQKAIDQQLYRSGRLRDRIQEEILRKTLFIDTEGHKTGQVNGLTVVNMGHLTFGYPTRITARVRVGTGDVVNIEREVEMSGPIHSKGVLILSAFLGARYALDKPLSLSASLVFEQSYGGVEGDSASSTELYALLSAIAGVPLKQSIAVTGSVNQHGEIQPIGGINEKIEGFFDICNMRGLTGDQGVIIPESNIKNLMLKQEVIDAVANERFHIYPVKSIDRGMEILAGMEMGAPDADGMYPKDTVNYLVEETLNRFASIRQRFSIKPNGKPEK